MSKIFFSPHSQTNNSPRILIGLEAHSEQDYSAHVAPYQGRSWPAPVLKFVVYDNTHARPVRAYAGSLSRDSASVVSVENSAVESFHEVPQDTAASVDAAGASASTRTDERRILIERLRELTSGRSGAISTTPSARSATKDDETITARPSPPWRHLTF